MREGAYRLDPASAPSMVDASGTGALVTLPALDGEPLAGLAVWGATEQDGEPSPESPAPLTSVSEAQVWASGRNLLGASPSAESLPEGLAASVASDGTFSVSGRNGGSNAAILTFAGDGLYSRLTAAAKAGRLRVAASFGPDSPLYFQVNAYRPGEDPRSVARVGGGDDRYELAVEPDDTINSVFVGCSRGDVDVSGAWCMVVADGDGGAAYAPPAASSLELPPSALPLRGLPDGTRDSVEVGVDGRARLVRRVGRKVLDGSETWNPYVDNPGYTYMSDCIRDAPHGIAGLDRTSGMLCDGLPVSNECYMTKTRCEVSLTSLDYPEYVYVNPPESAAGSKEDFKEWLADNPVELLYALATPQVTDLGTLSLPDSRGDPTHVWCAGDVPCEVSATAWLPAGRGCAALAGWLRDVESKIAALSAQALEA